MGRTLEDCEHDVYLCYDKNDTVIYVGCTYRVHQRFINHRSLTPWWPEVVSYRVYWAPNRTEALKLEEELIWIHGPIYNQPSARDLANL